MSSSKLESCPLLCREHPPAETNAHSALANPLIFLLTIFVWIGAGMALRELRAEGPAYNPRSDQVEQRVKPTDNDDRPNVIVILTDDQGWGDLSVHGNKNLSTPNLDQLARDGAQFDRFFVCPVCSPTRAEFLTGRYHPRLGVYSTSAGGERLNLDEETVADVFRKAGYVTGALASGTTACNIPIIPTVGDSTSFMAFALGIGETTSPPCLRKMAES